MACGWTTTILMSAARYADPWLAAHDGYSVPDVVVGLLIALGGGSLAQSFFHPRRDMHARPSNTSIRQLIKEALARSWTIAGGGQRHYKLFCPNECKCIQVLSSSTANQLSLGRARTRLSNHTCWESSRWPSYQPPVLPQ
jgi:hypothetical protein